MARSTQKAPSLPTLFAMSLSGGWSPCESAPEYRETRLAVREFDEAGAGAVAGCASGAFPEGRKDCVPDELVAIS